MSEEVLTLEQQRARHGDEFTSLEQLLADANRAQAAEAKEAPSLAMMIGLAGDDLERENQQGDTMRFVPRAPRLSKQKEMFALAAKSEGMATSEDPEQSVDVLIQMATKFLFVPDDSGKLRTATEAEIGDYFDLADINELVAKYLGLKKVEGEADASGK